MGGAELLMLNVFRAFDPERIEPRLICLRRDGTLADEFRTAGFEVEVLSRRGRFDVRTLPRLVRSFRRNRTDVVLVTHHHRASLALGRLAAPLGGVRATLVAAHDMDLTSLGQRCLPRWTVATLWLASALVLLSPRQGQYLHQKEGVGSRPWSRTREVIIANGIPLPDEPAPMDKARARRELGLGDHAFVVGIVARLSAQKAHEVLFEAFATLARSHPDARLVVIGDGDRRAELRKIAEEVGIEDRVRFTGVRRDVGALLPAFDVSVLSSVHEGVPLTVIESMAARVPVVATDCGALRDLIIDGEQGFVVPVKDSAALARCLRVLADDSVLRDRQGEAARKRAEEYFSIEQTADGYAALCLDLVRR